MEVIEGTGGVMALTDEDKVEIKKTLEAEVLPPGRVEFKSTQVTPTDDGQRLKVTGELSLNGNVHPLDFELESGRTEPYPLGPQWSSRPGTSSPTPACSAP